jgi:hypothetical protein
MNDQYLSYSCSTLTLLPPLTWNFMVYISAVALLPMTLSAIYMLFCYMPCITSHLIFLDTYLPSP